MVCYLKNACVGEFSRHRPCITWKIWYAKIVSSCEGWADRFCNNLSSQNDRLRPWMIYCLHVSRIWEVFVATAYHWIFGRVHPMLIWGWINVHFVRAWKLRTGTRLVSKINCQSLLRNQAHSARNGKLVQILIYVCEHGSKVHIIQQLGPRIRQLFIATTWDRMVGVIYLLLIWKWIYFNLVGLHDFTAEWTQCPCSQSLLTLGNKPGSHGRADKWKLNFANEQARPNNDSWSDDWYTTEHRSRVHTSDMIDIW